MALGLAPPTGSLVGIHLGDADLRVYFLNRGEILKFCSYLRGSTTNWAAAIRFYLVDESLVATLSEHERSRSEWQITFVDESVYLIADGDEHEGSVAEVDIWAEFQNSLRT